MSAEAPTVSSDNPLLDPLIAENILTWPTAMNAAWVLVCAYIVFMMQAGFTCLTVGSVRAKSAKSACVKNIADVCLGGMGYFLFGWAFAYGDRVNEDGTLSANGFIGTSQFALAGLSSSAFAGWLFQFVFAISTATIVSGAVAERLKIECYMLYSFFLTAWVYPVLSHWVWSPAGWINPIRNPSVGPVFLGTGVYDTVGSGAVHMLAGVAGLWGAWVLGPRRGRFDAEGKPLPMEGHNWVVWILGVLLLWYGFFGFNSGTCYAIVVATSPYSIFSDAVSRAALSTALGGCFGGTFGLLMGLLWHWVANRKVTFDLAAIGGGALSGMVCITSGCPFFHPWAAALGGIVGGLIYTPGSKFVLHVLKLDDVCDVIVIHLVCGAIGVIWPSLFATQSFVYEFYGPTLPNGNERVWGWWLGGGSGGAKLLGASVIWILVIFGWTTFWMLPFFLGCKAAGILRVSDEVELAGVDVSKHGGSAYVSDPIMTTLEGSVGPKELNDLRQQLNAMQDRLLLLEGNAIKTQL